MRKSSISRALMMRCFIGITGLLICLSTWTYYTVRRGLYKELDRSIEQTAALLANQVELEYGEIIYEWEEGTLQHKGSVDVGLFQYWDEKTGVTSRSPLLKQVDLPKFCGENGEAVMRDIDLPMNNHHARALGMRIYPFVLEREKQRMKEAGLVMDVKDRPHLLVVARDAKPIHKLLARMRWILGLGTFATILLGYWLIRQSVKISLKPLDDLCMQVTNRGGNRLDAALELPEKLPRELRELATQFNELLRKVSQVRERERDFIRHAAHELRTPIAGLQAIMDLALSKPRTPDAYVGYLQECYRATEDLGSLVKRLSALSRVGTQDLVLNKERLEVVGLLRARLLEHRKGIEGRGLRVVMEGVHEAWAVVDAVLFKIIWMNLLDNAVCYSVAGGEIGIAVGSSEQRVWMRVRNHCERLPEDVERLFEPLFRQGPEDGVEDRHLGIGLTLSMEAALAMGGSLTVERVGEDAIEFCLEVEKI